MQAERGSSFRGEKRLALVEWGLNAWLEPDVVRKVFPKAVSRWFSAHSSRQKVSHCWLRVLSTRRIVCAFLMQLIVY